MIVYVALTIYTGSLGQGRHQWDVPLVNFLQLLKVSLKIMILSVLRGVTV